MGGQTLLEGPGKEPILVLDRVADGRVGVFLSDHVWLWARGFDGGGPHAELLRRTAHWLMKEIELEEESLSLSMSDNGLIIERQSVVETEPVVELELPNGEKVEHSLAPVSPGLYRVEIENPAVGYYRATTGELFALGFVGGLDITEFRNVVSTIHQLEPAATRTGGGLYMIREGNAVQTPSIRKIESNSVYTGETWAGIAARNAAQVDAIRDQQLVPPIVWLFIVLASVIAAWAIEGGRLNLSRQSVNE